MNLTAALKKRRILGRKVSNLRDRMKVGFVKKTTKHLNAEGVPVGEPVVKEPYSEEDFQRMEGELESTIRELAALRLQIVRTNVLSGASELIIKREELKDKLRFYNELKWQIQSEEYRSSRQGHTVIETRMADAELDQAIDLITKEIDDVDISLSVLNGRTVLSDDGLPSDTEESEDMGDDGELQYDEL